MDPQNPLTIPPRIKAALEFIKRKNSDLFHYSNAKQNILALNEVWITRADSFLDQTEIEYGTQVLLEAVKKHKHLNVDDKSELRNVVEEYRLALRRSYIFSTSESQNNDYLLHHYGKEIIRLEALFSDWMHHGARHRAQEGNGYRMHYFHELYDLHEGTVIYDRNKQLKLAETVIDALFEYFQANEKWLLFYIQKLLVLVIALSKDASFQEENEYRIILISRSEENTFENSRDINERKVVYIKCSLPGGNRKFIS